MSFFGAIICRAIQHSHMPRITLKYGKFLAFRCIAMFRIQTISLIYILIENGYHYHYVSQVYLSPAGSLVCSLFDQLMWIVISLLVVITSTSAQRLRGSAISLETRAHFRSALSAAGLLAGSLRIIRYQSSACYHP